MPTRDRRRFVGQSIRYFQNQDYPWRELIVVDDGEDCVADLVPGDDPCIRYVRLDAQLSLGDKRNLGNGMASGAFIAHWDDDDWMAPDRLSVQVRRLVEAQADVCGARELLYYRPDAGEAWLYRYPDTSRAWLSGATLLYRREVWAKTPFRNLTVGEDSAFLRDLDGARLHALADPVFYVGLIHDGNTAGKNTAGPRWRRRPLAEATQRLANDRGFYGALRNGRATVEPAVAAPPAVSVAGHFDVATGYGGMTEYTVLGMARAGVRVNVLPLALRPEGLTAEFQDLLRRSRPDAAAPVLYCSWPRAELRQFANHPDLFFYTMWEASRLPPGWADAYNRGRAVIVPSRFVADAFRASGVTAPIEVVPEGVDPAVYPYVERPARAGLTTLIVGPVDERKNALVAIAAWKRAFADDADARLIVKTSYGYHNYTPDDPRIRYVDAVEKSRGILHWYRQADILLALGNEGFGLPLVEGMATGLPVIALRSEGQADVCREAGDLVLAVDPVAWREYRAPNFGGCGLRGVPGVDDVAERLRWIAERPSQAQAIGRAASVWAHTHRDVWRKGPAIFDVIDRRAGAARARARRAMWTPSLGRVCGVADYSGRLAKAMPALVEPTAAPPAPRRHALLHVQHEPGLIDDATLEDALRAAAGAGAVTAATQHAVDPCGRRWEAQARGFVSLTQAGAALLKSRWPQKHVAHIAHGCPTEFPKRKPGRGAVIGAFGFLARHKGFWRLLEALRALPQAQLLIFAHPRSARDLADWRRSCAGLNVRHVAECLPADEVMRRLAAEADVLAFPYDAVSAVSASGAVTFGLASGVPVLTSPTPWFEGLQEATYQTADLVDGLGRLIEDSPLRERLTAAAREHCHANSWPRVARRHLDFWERLCAH